MIPLSKRELEVLKVLATGVTYQEAADKLFISTDTVHWYTWAIYRKTGTHRVLQACLATGVLVRGDK